MGEQVKTRYSDAELQEFKAIIEKKMNQSQEELNNLLKSLQSDN